MSLHELLMTEISVNGSETPREYSSGSRTFYSQSCTGKLKINVDHSISVTVGLLHLYKSPNMI